ncbi:MAG TPA: response regulator [Spirochaetota bacterium]|nr:response regulator [Spirochaetota bacterium]HPJ34573.1 response regulator [Spirochaetota bacterium]
MKMLIVDDSFVIRKTIEKYAIDLGIKDIYTAPNGREAIRIFGQESPSLVTMDITMPEMDGIECLEELLKLDPSAKIIIITALKDSATGLLALKKGASGFISKPFTPEQIRDEIISVTGGNI